MKTIRVPMSTDAGGRVWWTVRRFDGVWNAGGDIPGKGRKISGWLFIDHEGCQRSVEGNWLALVEAFRAVALNYGLATNIS